MKTAKISVFIGVLVAALSGCVEDGVVGDPELEGVEDTEAEVAPDLSEEVAPLAAVTNLVSKTFYVNAPSGYSGIATIGIQSDGAGKVRPYIKVTCSRLSGGVWGAYNCAMAYDPNLEFYKSGSFSESTAMGGTVGSDGTATYVGAWRTKQCGGTYKVYTSNWAGSLLTLGYTTGSVWPSIAPSASWGC